MTAMTTGVSRGSPTVTVPGDIVIAWADASNDLAQVLHADTMTRLELLTAGRAYLEAAMPLLQLLAEITDDALQGTKPRLTIVR
jgi:DNA-binding transcriptional LysR family regulator